MCKTRPLPSFDLMNVSCYSGCSAVSLLSPKSGVGLVPQRGRYLSDQLLAFKSDFKLCLCITIGLLMVQPCCGEPQNI